MKFKSLESIGSLAVVGATGIVGREFLSLLDEHKICIPEIRLLASEDSAGQAIRVGEREMFVDELNAQSFEGVEAAFFSVPNSVTREFVPIAVEAGCLVVDDSNCYRSEPGVPIVVPELNGYLLKDFDGRIISTPNCSVTPLALCLKPLSDRYGLKRVVVSTYQSVSGAGRRVVEELSDQSAVLLNGKTATSAVFSHRIAFNCLPLIGSATESGDSEEETKVVRELRKILELPSLLVSASAVRVPTFCSHGAAVNVECESELDALPVVRELFDGSAGVKVIDKPPSDIYATNVEATGTDEVFVSRIRRDYSVRSGLNLWVIADNLRKGAALNALQILDTLYMYRRMS